MGKEAPGHSDIPVSSALWTVISFVLVLLMLGGCEILTRGDLLEKMDIGITGNIPPDADAGVDFSVVTGNTAALDGGGSSDADSDPLAYTWYFVAVPVGSLLTDGSIIDRFTSTPTFIPDIDGTYTLELQVDDGESIDLDTIDIIASAVNNPPVADAGADLNVFSGDTAVLDGSASFDPDMDPLSYFWTFTTIPGGSLLTDGNIVGINTDNPSFVTDTKGSYILELTVDDGMDFTLDTVTVTANNNPPVADAGTDQAGLENTTFTLDGSGSSDADLDPLSYIWTFISIPGGSILTDGDIIGINTTMPSLIPDVAGNFLLELTVDDGTDTNTDTVVVTSTATELVGEWLFSGGSLIDTSGFGSTAIANGAIPTPDRDGNPGAAYFFDGISASINLGNGMQLNYTDMMSFSCWFRADDIIADVVNGYGRIVSKRDNSPVAGWELNVGTGDTISTNRAGIQNATNNSPGILQGVWHHLVFTWDPHAPVEQIKFYLDGNLLAGTGQFAGSDVEPPASAMPLTLGTAAYAPVSQFMGAIDDVRFYHGILLPGDVTALASEISVP